MVTEMRNVRNHQTSSGRVLWRLIVKNDTRYQGAWAPCSTGDMQIQGIIMNIIPSPFLETDSFWGQNTISRSIFPFWNYRVWQIYFYTSHLLSELLFPLIFSPFFGDRGAWELILSGTSQGIFKRMYKQGIWMTVSKNLFHFIKNTYS